MSDAGLSTGLGSGYTQGWVRRRVRRLLGVVILAGLGMGSGSGFGSGLRPWPAGGKMFAGHCSCLDHMQECHALVLARRMVRLRVRLKVSRLTLGQGGQAQDS